MMILPMAMFVLWDSGEFVLIVDKSKHGGSSVTNAVERVVAELVGFGIPVDQRRIIYQDSEGRWDGIATRDGAFAGFIVLNDDNVVDAINAVNLRVLRGEWKARKPGTTTTKPLIER